MGFGKKDTHLSRKHMDSCERASMGVGWSRGARWESHFQTEDCLVGCIQKGEFEEYFEAGEGLAVESRGRQLMLTLKPQSLFLCRSWPPGN